MNALELSRDPDFIEEIIKKDYVHGGVLYRCNDVIKELGISSSKIVCYALLLLKEKGLLEVFKKNGSGVKYEVLHVPLNEYLEGVWIGKF